MSRRVFKPSQALTFDTVERNSKRLRKVLRHPNVTCIQLELQHVTQCDSAGLAFLIEAKRLSQQEKKILMIEHVSKMIYSLAEFCGVNRMLVKDD